MDGLRTLDQSGAVWSINLNQKYGSPEAKTRALIPDFASSVFTRIGSQVLRIILSNITSSLSQYHASKKFVL